MEETKKKLRCTTFIFDPKVWRSRIWGKSQESWRRTNFSLEVKKSRFSNMAGYRSNKMLNWMQSILSIIKKLWKRTIIHLIRILRRSMNMKLQNTQMRILITPPFLWIKKNEQKGLFQSVPKNKIIMKKKLLKYNLLIRRES